MTKLDSIDNSQTRNKASFKDVISFLGNVLLGFSILGHYPQGDAIKQEYVAFITIRIIQIIALSLIAIGLIVSIIIRLTTLTEVNISSNDIGPVLACYFGSFLLIISGIITPKLLNWMNTPFFPREKGVFISLMLRTVFLAIPIIFASLLLVKDNSWITAIILYILIGIALVITFPTKKRWKKYMNWSSLLD